MIAGVAVADITPKDSVWMDGMIREHPSEGVNNALFAKALYLADGNERCAIVSLDICAIRATDAQIIRDKIEVTTGIPAAHVVLAASHTHSGPATLGFFNQVESDYVRCMGDIIVVAVSHAVKQARPVLAGYACGSEGIISHYRRFLSDDGKVVMMWEQNPSLGGLKAMGEADSEVGVLRLSDVGDPERSIALLYNHAGHPNVMSGENYAISADYPGIASRILEDEFGCMALFTNGAQGSVDIDNWKWRGWDGMEEVGGALAQIVSEVAEDAQMKNTSLRVAHTKYTLSRRKITDEELSWADEVIKLTGGKTQALADGVGDDYKAILYKKIHETRHVALTIKQTCITVGDCAFISFPGELFTEIGVEIKRRSPFEHTFIIGLANGYVGYVPTREAISQGGYEVDTRKVDADAERIIIEHSLELLQQIKKGEDYA